MWSEEAAMSEKNRVDSVMTLSQNQLRFLRVGEFETDVILFVCVSREDSHVAVFRYGYLTVLE